MRDGSAVLNRIKPVGEVLIEPASGGKSAEALAASANGAKAAAAPAPSAATTPAAPVAAAAVADGSRLPPRQSRTARRSTTRPARLATAPGIAGAPKFGDKAAWAPRIKLGIDALHASALKGKGAMPPKGGNVTLPDADVVAAVDYMVAAAK